MKRILKVLLEPINRGIEMEQKKESPKLYNRNDLYIGGLYVVEQEDYVTDDTICLTSKFLDYTIIEYDTESYLSAKYVDVMTGKRYEGKMISKGQVYISSKSLTKLSTITTKENWTTKELETFLNEYRRRNTSELQLETRRREIIGQVVETLTLELGEEKTYMLLNQIIDELGIEKTQEITSPLSEEVGYNIVENAKNIERTRK